MALDTANKRGSAIGLKNPTTPVFPVPGTTQDGDFRQQIANEYSGILAHDPATDIAIGSWITTEVGNYTRSITDQFGGGGNILQAWKAEALAAALAGPPYPDFKPVLKRLMLEYFITVV